VNTAAAALAFWRNNPGWLWLESWSVRLESPF
jgi:hypothetical protein